MPAFAKAMEDVPAKHAKKRENGIGNGSVEVSLRGESGEVVLCKPGLRPAERDQQWTVIVGAGFEGFLLR